MRTIWWFIYFWAYLLKLIPRYKRAIKLRDNNDQDGLQKAVFKEVKDWASSLLKVAGVEVEVKGLENIPKEAALFVSNHQGNFDIPILLSKLDEPKSVVAKIELENFPFISGWMKLFDCVFIDRNNPRQCLKILGDAENILKKGKSVIIFPEGTRSKSSELGDFKAGAFRTAVKAKTPIVPVMINGSYKVMEANGIWIKPTKVKLTILPAINTIDLSKEETKTIGEDVKKIIAEEISKS